MARLSRTESMARTRAQVLTAAQEVFAEKGIAGTSIEQIAERAGYTRGAVYAHFAGKDELAIAVLDLWLDEQIAGGEVIQSAGGTDEVLNELATHEGNRFADRRKFMLLTEFRLYAMRRPEVRERLAELDRRQLSWYTDAIEVAARHNAIELPAPASELALAVLGLENGIAALAHTDPDRVPHHAFVDAVSLLARIAMGPAT